jgi:hypothetical protein
LLCSCGWPCGTVAGVADDVLVLTLAQSADALAGATGATVDARNGTVALLRAPASARDATLGHACALAEVLPPW